MLPAAPGTEGTLGCRLHCNSGHTPEAGWVCEAAAGACGRVVGHAGWCCVHNQAACLPALCGGHGLCPAPAAGAAGCQATQACMMSKPDAGAGQLLQCADVCRRVCAARQPAAAASVVVVIIQPLKAPHNQLGSLQGGDHRPRAAAAGVAAATAAAVPGMQEVSFDSQAPHGCGGCACQAVPQRCFCLRQVGGAARTQPARLCCV